MMLRALALIVGKGGLGVSLLCHEAQDSILECEGVEQ
jgi:hypothetical protein